MNSERQLLPTHQPVPPIWGESAESSPLDVIIFSKDRAAQLDALLRSMRAFLLFPHRLHLIYAASNPEFELGYDQLRRWHRGIHWLADDGMFRGVTMKLVKNLSQGVGRYLMFLVDDLLFTRPFTAEHLMRSLDDDPKVLAVSLRMGKGITYSYLHDKVIQPPDFSNGYRWAWKESRQPYWNYPMSLDGHIFRTGDVADLLPKLNFNSPNSLEAALAGQPLARPDLVCEASPSLVNISANRVQSLFPNRCGSQEVTALNQALLAGKAIDVRPFTGRMFNACHIEEILILVPDERSPEVPGWERIQRDSREYLRIDLRQIPTFILNCSEDKEKRLLMQEQLDELGLNYEFIPTMRITPGWVGVALAHLKALRLSRARPPFLVLEDDCVFEPNFQPVIEIPAGADCLYLSASLFGLGKPGQMSTGKIDNVFWSRHASGYLRVYNMLARHALLYLNADFQKAAIEAGLEAISNRHWAYPCDIGIAMLQMTRTALLAEMSICKQINRNATGGNLAELLPANEWVEGKTINAGLPKPLPRHAEKAAPLAVGLVSHKYRFIYFQIGKNASRSLRGELSKPIYACEPCMPREIDAATLNSYFKFTFLRDPVSRLVSAYQEISMRHDMQDSTVRNRPFMQMEDSPERFEAFIDQVKKDKWDRHVYTQRSLLGNVPMDFYGRVESLDSDLQIVFDRLGLGSCPALPRSRSRSNRKSQFGYKRFNIDHQQLSPLQVSRIRAIYQEDVNLIQTCCPVPPLHSGLPSSSQSRALQILQAGDPDPIELFKKVNEQHEECFVYVLGNRGFYAEVSTVVRAMIWSWVHGYRLLLDSADSAWAYELGWADYFEPFCASSAEVAADKIVRHLEFHCPADLTTRKELFKFLPEEITFGRHQIRGFNNIMAFFTAMVFRPTQQCLDQVEQLTLGLDLRDPYDAIHIRRGDKVGDEDIFHSAETYLQKLGVQAQGKNLFVMSDDWAAVQEVRDYLRDQNLPIRLASLVSSDRRGFDVAKLRKGSAFIGPLVEVAGGCTQRESVRDQVRTLIAESLVAAKSVRFVSTWRSNVGRMIWYLHNNHHECVLLMPRDQALNEGPRPGRSPEEQAPIPGKAGSYYEGSLHLRGGIVHEFEIPAGSACLTPLRRLLSRGHSARESKLFQLPLQQGRSVLTFSGADVRFLSLTKEVSCEQHHPLTMMEEGHLGGYLQSRHTRAAEYGTHHGDPATYTPALWQWVIDTLGVRSMLDVGCGEGHAAAFFRDNGCAALGVDGSVNAERNSVIAGLHHRHDYTLGPFVPSGSWDLVWSCEFVEHVEECYVDNFLASFDCARKYLLMTYAPPGQPGWHHVNCQPEGYWVKKLTGLGFRLDEPLTAQARALVEAGHFQHRGLVFVRAEAPQAA